MSLNLHPENLDYFYVKTNFFYDYPIDYPDDLQNPYIIFKLEIKEDKVIIQQNGINYVRIEYHYIIKDTLIFTNFKNQTEINNYVNDKYSGIFICKQNKKLCLWDNSLYGLSPRSIINFGEDDDINDDINKLHVFYNDIKLDSKTLEDSVKEILFNVYVN